MFSAQFFAIGYSRDIPVGELHLTKCTVTYLRISAMAVIFTRNYHKKIYLTKRRFFDTNGRDFSFS